MSKITRKDSGKDSGKGSGSGRTKGSTSFVTVSLAELNRVLKSEAQVMVSRRFMEMLSLKGEDVVASTENIKTLVGLPLLEKKVEEVVDLAVFSEKCDLSEV